MLSRNEGLRVPPQELTVYLRIIAMDVLVPPTVLWGSQLLESQLRHLWARTPRAGAAHTLSTSMQGWGRQNPPKKKKVKNEAKPSPLPLNFTDRNRNWKLTNSC